MGTPSQSYGIWEPDTEGPGKQVTWGFLLCPWGLAWTQAPYLTPGKRVPDAQAENPQWLLPSLGEEGEVRGSRVCKPRQREDPRRWGGSVGVTDLGCPLSKALC